MTFTARGKMPAFVSGTTLVVPPTSHNHEGFSPCFCFEGARFTTCEKARLRHRKSEGADVYSLRKNACSCTRARPWSCRQHREIMRGFSHCVSFEGARFTACEKARLRHRKVKGHDLQPAEKCLLLYQGTTLVVPPASQNHEGFSHCVFFERPRLHRLRKTRSASRCCAGSTTVEAPAFRPVKRDALPRAFRPGKVLKEHASPLAKKLAYGIEK